MGCDGGTIPKRHELVKTKQKPEQKDADMERNAKWSHCAISQQELRLPIVACELGKLYNKEAVIEFLLDKSSTSSAEHLKSLKDVKELKLTRNSEFDRRKGELADQYHDTMASEYICPVVGIEMNGKYRFCFLWKCGCVLSERALKEVPTTTCHKCGQTFDNKDIIFLNQDGDELEKMRENMIARRSAAKLERKSKKDKKKSESHRELLNGETSFKVINGTKHSLIGSKPADENVKRKKLDRDTALVKQKSKIVDTGSKSNGSATSTKKEEVSIDPTKSRVYKSLFTSSEEAKNRSGDRTSNWITYNPYHL